MRRGRHERAFALVAMARKRRGDRRYIEDLLTKDYLALLKMQKASALKHLELQQARAQDNHEHAKALRAEWETLEAAIAKKERAMNTVRLAGGLDPIETLGPVEA